MLLQKIIKIFKGELQQKMKILPLNTHTQVDSFLDCNATNFQSGIENCPCDSRGSVQIDIMRQGFFLCANKQN